MNVEGAVNGTVEHGNAVRGGSGVDRYISPAQMSHAGFPFHLSLPHRDHRVLFHSRYLTVLWVVKSGKTCQRE